MRAAVTTALLSALLVGLAAAQPAPRQRLEDFETDPVRVAAFKRAVSVMKSRKPSDPTSWFFQAAVHGVTDAAESEAATADPAVNAVDRARYWNQCPHFTKRRNPSADFVIWHRAYLYHFERILRAASGDPTLSLPYWNYTESGHRSFPRLFANPEDMGAGPTNPLYDPRREVAFMNGVLDLGEAAIDVQDAFDATRFFASPAANAFAGAHDDSEPDDQGRLERSPHNMIHFAIGGFIAGTPPNPGTVGLMSDVETAASDPIFWVHHANIDRLAQVWACLPNRQWGRAPKRSWFEAKRWWFHDADGSPYNHPRSYYVSAKGLGIAFDTDDAGCSPLTDALPPVPPGPAAPEPAPPTTTEVAVSAGPLPLSAREPTSVEVAVGNQRVFGARNLGAAMQRGGARKRHTVLQLRQVDYDRPPAVAYDIFVDMPAGTTPSRKDPHFVGTLALFGIKHAAGHGVGTEERHGGTNSFDITRLVTSRAASAGPLRITVVPRPLYAARAGAPAAPAPPAEGNVVIGRVAVVAVEGN